MSGREHALWCVARARESLEQVGEAAALSSLMSDLRKEPGASVVVLAVLGRPAPGGGLAGLLDAIEAEVDRRWPAAG